MSGACIIKSWVFIFIVEFVVFLLFAGINLHVPARDRRILKKSWCYELLGYPAEVIDQRIHLNWAGASLVVAFSTVMIFGIKYFREMVQAFFNSWWFGYVIIVLCLIVLYILLGMILIFAAAIGEVVQEDLLEKHYGRTYGRYITRKE